MHLLSQAQNNGDGKQQIQPEIHIVHPSNKQDILKLELADREHITDNAVGSLHELFTQVLALLHCSVVWAA